MKPFDYSEFTRAIGNAKFDKPLLQQAQTVFLAFSEPEQRAVVSACSGLSGLRNCGAVTAFEIMVAVVQVCYYP